MNTAGSNLEREAVKESIRSRLDIVDVVGRYVSLKPAGSNMKARCPFHNERSPSFMVNPSRQIFHCFGCGKGGDVFTFLMEIEGLSFAEVMRRTAEETGIRLPQFSERSEKTSSAGEISRETMLKIHDLAVKFYYSQIKGNQAVIEYFKKRGLAPETVRDFLIGYAPAGWDGFVSYAASKGVKPAACAACGLAVARPDGTAYDRFRERIMFPVCDISGRAVAFGGRAIGDDEPKYLNSPETALYHKNRILYGLHRSRQSIKESGFVILVEGYMDFLGLFQAGITNCAAVSGTALTTEHGRMIKRFASRVVLMFDGDAAGESAAKRSVYLLAPAGLDVRVMTLPGGHDPDTFVLENGAAALMALVESARPCIQFALDAAVAAHGVATPQAKSQVVSETAPLAADTADQIVASEYIRQISERTGVREQFVLDAVSKIRRPQQSNQISYRPQEAPAADFLKGPEAGLLSLLVRHPSLIDSAMERISPESFTDSFSADLYSFIVDVYRRDPDLSTLPGGIDEGEIKRVLSRMLIDDSRVVDPRGELRYAIKRIEVKQLKTAMRSIRERLKQEKIGEDKNMLLRELQSIVMKLKELESQ